MARIGLFLILVLAAAMSVAGPVSAQTRIVAVVNGDPITNYDVAQRSKLLRLTGVRSNVESAALDELINEKVQDNAVKRYQIEVSKDEIDAAIAGIASRAKITPAQLDGAFRQAGVSISTLRERIGSQIGFSRLIQAQFRQSLQITEQDLVAALKRDEEKELVIDAPLYDLQQVTIALPESPSPQRMKQAEATAADLRRKFNSCSEGIAMAKKTRNVVVRQTGRRMGVEFAPAVREVLDKTPVGKLTEPVPQPRGLVMFAVCDKTMVRSANAAMKEIEPELSAERGEAFAKQYLRQLKRDAIIEKRG